MAINIPRQTTLMDHLSNVGQRYVQNKAETDRLRLQQDFQAQESVKQQNYMRGIADQSNETQLALVNAQAENNRLLKQTRTADITAQLENDTQNRVRDDLFKRYQVDQSGKLRTAEFQSNDKLARDLKEIDKQIANFRNSTTLSLADKDNLGQLERMRVSIEGQAKLQTDALASSERVNKMVDDTKRYNIDSLASDTLMEVMARKSMNKDNNQTQLSVAGIGADVENRRTDVNENLGFAELRTRRSINTDNNQSARGLAELGYYEQGQQLDKKLFSEGQSLGRTLLAQKEFQSSEQRHQENMQNGQFKFQQEFQESQFEHQANMTANERALYGVEVQKAQYVLDQAIKNPQGTIAEKLAPILAANGISMEDFLNPRDDGRIKATMKALLNVKILPAVANLVVGTHFGYEDDNDRKAGVYQSLQDNAAVGTYLDGSGVGLMNDLTTLGN